jgi:hypothetical protein
MKVFIVHAHAGPRSFNGAMFQTAQETLKRKDRRRPFNSSPSTAAG